MATAADWMSGASFVAMAGGIYFKGYGYMALLVGWTGGYVLVASLLAFVILIFWFAGRQEKIDEEFGFTEREDS
jgi:putative solute:sodium symporter small subunit